MNSEFANKEGKPTGKEYLSASLEDVIDRANNSSNQSEIPFVTALFAAKSHENQKKISSKMLYVAIVTTVIAVLSLAQSYFSSIKSTNKAQELTSIRNEISGQDKRIIELQTKIVSIEFTVQSLKIEKEEYLGIIKHFTTVFSQHDHNNSGEKHNKPIQPTTKAAAD